MSSICHLSGLPLRSGARVLILPVAYGMPAGSAYCYSANEAADLFHFPLLGQSQDFGMVRVENGYALLTYINDNLAYKTTWFTGDSPYHFGSELFACLKGNQDGEPLRGKWIEPHTILEPSTPENRVKHVLQHPFVSCDALFKTLLEGGLTQLGQTKLKTYSYLVVDYAFFLKLARQIIGDRIAQGVKDLLSQCMKTLALWQGEDHREQWSAVGQLLSGNTLHNTFQIGMNVALEQLFKSTLETLMQDLFEQATDASAASAAILDVLESMAHAAAVYQIYQRLGRTFLPQTNQVHAQTLDCFARMLAGEIDARRVKCRAALLEDGYTETDDAETLDHLQWRNL